MYEDRDKAVSKKKSLVVVIFFVYIIYSVCLVFKYVFALDTFKEKYPKLHGLSKNFAKVAEDMIGKNFFYLIVLFMSTQVDPTIFSSMVSYAYLGVLGLQIFGALITPKSEADERAPGYKPPPNYRALGILAIFVMTLCIYFSLMISPWCKCFFYAQIFSKKPTPLAAPS